MVGHTNIVSADRGLATQALAVSLRSAAAATFTVIALISAVGITEGALFAAPSLLKYVLTVLAPVVGVLLVTVRHPLRLVVTLAIVCIPAAGTNAFFGGVKVSPLAVILLVGVFIAIVSGPPARSLSSVGAAGLASAALLVGPIIIGKDSGAAVLIGAMILVTWLVSRLAQEGEQGWLVIYGAVVAAALFQALLAIYEYKTKHHVNLYGSAGATQPESSYFGTAAGKAGEVHSTQRPTGTLYDPISLGNVLAMSCPILLTLATRSRGLLLKLILAPVGVVIVLALALSFSRFSWIGGAVGIIVAACSLGSWRQTTLALGTVIATLGIVALLALATAGKQLISRVESVANPTHASNRVTARGDRERVATWADDVKIFESHPIGGVGLGQIYRPLASYLPHAKEGTNGQNTYLQVAAEAGLLGISALVLILSTSAKSLTRAVRSSVPLAGGALGAGTAVLVVWLTDVSVRYTPVAAFFAIVIGLASAASSDIRYDRERVSASASATSPALAANGGALA